MTKIELEKEILEAERERKELEREVEIYEDSIGKLWTSPAEQEIARSDASIAREKLHKSYEKLLSLRKRISRKKLPEEKTRKCSADVVSGEVVGNNFFNRRYFSFDVTVKAASLEEALKKIEEETLIKVGRKANSKAYVDRIADLDTKEEIYLVVFDGGGALGAYGYW